jgi:hypothetical protein
LLVAGFVCMLFRYVSHHAEGYGHVSMLSVLLYVCVFWRGQAEQLERNSAEIFPTHRQRSWPVGFLLLDSVKDSAEQRKARWRD